MLLPFLPEEPLLCPDLHWCCVTASWRPLLCPDLHWCFVTASCRPLLCPDRARETHVAGGAARICRVHSHQTDEVSRSHHLSFFSSPSVWLSSFICLSLFFSLVFWLSTPDLSPSLSSHTSPRQSSSPLRKSSLEPGTVNYRNRFVQEILH